MLMAAVALFGCDPIYIGNGTSSVDPPIIPEDTFTPLAGPADAHDDLCENEDGDPDFPNTSDRLTRVFCQDVLGGETPTPTGLNEFLALLDLDIDPSGGNGTGGNPGFALLGHSSALTARKVSSITPTVFVFDAPAAGEPLPEDLTFVAFDPGELFLEVASANPAEDGEMNFYLVQFDKDCVNTPGGCTNVDLLTPELTRGWSNIRIYESDTELNNTIADCAACHQPEFGDDMILRMQEISAPFTHWFSAETDGGKELLADFHATHGTNEDYGPIPAALIDASDPALMAQIITDAGFGDQPNAFDSASIEAEVIAEAPQQPAVNVPPGWSASWQAIYDAAVAGEFIAAPYHDVKVTDPRKLERASTAYRAWQNGERSDLPNIQDVFLDGALPDMGFAAKPGLDGRQLLVQLCQQCHNANLDPGISRDNFRVDQLDQMSREEKDLAIERLNDPIDTALRMPPALFRTMSNAERQAMIDELRK